MKKAGITFIILLACNLSMYGQQSVFSKGELAKAGLQNTLVTVDYTEFFLSSIPLSPVQKPLVNKLFQEHMASRKTIYYTYRKDPATNKQKQAELFQTFLANLATLLTSSQMNAFLATKPLSNDTTNFLSVLFY